VMTAVLLATPSPAGMRGLFDFVGILVLVPLIVIVGASSDAPASLRSPFAIAGAVSYALYVTHSPILTPGRFLKGEIDIVPVKK
jgi:peptidoglycan/LPS O-acetylase OafA/YrhL